MPSSNNTQEDSEQFALIGAPDDELLDDDGPGVGCEDWPPPLLQAASVITDNPTNKGEMKRSINLSVLEVMAETVRFT
jgi:hypothetical protein